MSCDVSLATLFSQTVHTSNTQHEPAHMSENLRAHSRTCVWSAVQTCIRPSWCHCHWLSLASVKSRLVLPFWYWLTRVVPDKGPLNGCVCVCVLEKESILLSGIIKTRDACDGTFKRSERHICIQPIRELNYTIMTVCRAYKILSLSKALQYIRRHVDRWPTCWSTCRWSESTFTNSANPKYPDNLKADFMHMCTCLSCVVTHVNLLCFLDFTVHIIFAQIFEWMPLLLLLYMSIIMVALSHYCCRTTLQCQCHVSPAKEQSQYLSAPVQREHKTCPGVNPQRNTP